MALSDPNCRRTVVATVLVAIVIAGCTGGDDSTPATTTPPTIVTDPSTTSSAPPPEATASYILALADPAMDASTLAVGDAAHYLDHRRLGAQAIGEQLVALPGTTTHQLCGEAGCAVIDRVVTDPSSGRISTFAVDGRPIAGRIAGSGLVADDDGVVAQTRSAYVTNAGQLVVAVEISNTMSTDVEVFPFAAVHRDADGGSGIEAEGSFGEPRLAPGTSSIVLLVFDVQQLGGRIALRGLRSDGIEVVLGIDVPGGAAADVVPVSSDVSRDSEG